MTRAMKPLAAKVGLAMAMVLVVGLLFSGSADAAISWKKKIDDKEIKVTFYGFGQFEIRQGDGLDPGGDATDIRFQAQRIRIGTNYFHGKVFAKLFLDFNQSFTSKEAGLVKAVKDAFVGMNHSNAFFWKIGMMKAPVGMSFTIPGWNLDNIERNGLDKGLVLERDFGLMVSGRGLGWGDGSLKVNGTEMGHERWGHGFGYDVGIFNPAGRSSAVLWNDGGAVGEALAYAGRLHFDFGTQLHTEISMGVSEDANGVPGTGEDYEVMNAGANSFLMDDRLNLKLEYTSGDNIRGEDGWEQDTITFTVGWRFVPTVELILKHYMSESTRASVDTDLQNTYVGLVFFVEPLKDKPRTLQNHKISVFYVTTGGDDFGSSTSWGGIGGYKDDVVLAQYQYKF